MTKHKSRVALVTGASRGIGRTVAIGLAEDGYDLALVARSKPGLEKVAKEIGAKTKANEPLLFPIDVRDDEAVKKVVSDTVKQLGRIDLLFNNAGIAHLGTLEVSVDEFDEIHDVNVRGPFSFLQAVVPIMKKQKSGHIINLSSNSGKIGHAGWGAYCSSKFALLGLNESLYRELSHTGIRVTALCPSWVDTDMAREGGCELSSKEMIQTQDILKTVRWLVQLSPAASVRELVIDCAVAVD